MNSVSLIFPYYNSPIMLERQLAEWWAYESLAEDGKFEIILVDDCSLISAMDVLSSSIMAIPPYLSVYRVLKDIPWNQHGCRNLGAKRAKHDWLFLTDIDHTVPAATLKALTEMELSTAFYYTFQRLSALSRKCEDVELMLDKNGLPKPHPNTFFLPKKVYWQAGGYDEDYCGTYGGDGQFKRAVENFSIRYHMPDLSIVRWPRSVIEDASQPDDFRQAYKLEYRKRFEKKGKSRALKPRNPIRFPWERVL